MTYGSKALRSWVLEEAEARPFFRLAIESGINFFDTADLYCRGVSEEITGRALKELAPRDRVVIATKVGRPMGEDPNHRGLGRKHVMHAIDASLKRLGTDYVDLYQVHRFDPETPIEETIQTLHDIVKSGKARYIGASSMYAYQLAQYLYKAREMGLTPFVSMQNHYNLVYREEEREMIPLLQQEGLAMLPWSPLARGFLAGNRHRQGGGATVRAQADEFAGEVYYADCDFIVADRVGELAANRGVRPAQIALAWHFTKSYVTAPIVGASKLSHLEDALAALSIKLEADEVKVLEAAYVPHRVLGH
jgi:aryl-alcohol dehydrogenase (NADP+)